MKEALARYQSLLARLKRNPTDPDIREQTLKAGRDYSSLTRNNKQVALFDEVALGNDISAACAAAAQPSQRTISVSPSAAQTIKKKLESLKELKDSGLLTEQEYQARRSKLLDEM